MKKIGNEYYLMHKNIHQDVFITKMRFHLKWV